MAFPSLLSDHEQRAFSEFLNQLAQEDSAKPPGDGRGSPLDAATLHQQQQQLQLQLQHHLHLRQLQMQHQQQQQQQQQQHYSAQGAPSSSGTTLSPPFGANGAPEMDQHQGIAQQHREWIQMLSANPILAPGGVIDPHAMSQAFLANPELMAQANAITQAMVLAQQQQMQMQRQQQQQQHFHTPPHHHPIPHPSQLPVPPHLLSQPSQHQQPHHLSMSSGPYLSQEHHFHHGEHNANSMEHISPPVMGPPPPSSHQTSPGSMVHANQDPAMSDSNATLAAAKTKSTFVKRKSKSSAADARASISEPAGSSMIGSPSTPPHSEQLNHTALSESQDEEFTQQHNINSSSIRKGSLASLSDRANGGGDYPSAEDSGNGGTSLKRKGSSAAISTAAAGGGGGGGGSGSAVSGYEGNEDDSPTVANGTGSGGSTTVSTASTIAGASSGKGTKEISAKGGRPGQTTSRAKKPHHELLTEAEKKANHIASEQKRRQNIRIGFDSLVEIVPTLSDCHRSEALILQKSVDYIQRLLQQKKELKERVRDLQRHLGDSIDDDDSATEMEVEEHMRP